MLPHLLSFALILQAAPAPPCTGVQCALGCFPLGSVCPSTTEARLQGLVVDQEEAPKPEVKPLSIRRPRLELTESCEERRWGAFRRRREMMLIINAWDRNRPEKTWMGTIQKVFEPLLEPRGRQVEPEDIFRYPARGAGHMVNVRVRLGWGPTPALG